MNEKRPRGPVDKTRTRMVDKKKSATEWLTIMEQENTKQTAFSTTIKQQATRETRNDAGEITIMEQRQCKQIYGWVLRYMNQRTRKRTD